MTLRVSRLESGQLDDLESSLANCGHLPFSRLRDIPADGLRHWIVERFDAAAGDASSRALVARSAEGITAGLVLQCTDWESSLYDLPMARIPFVFTTERESAAALECGTQLLEAAGRELMELGVRHCSAQVLAEDVGLSQSFARHGWLPTDSTLEICWESGRTTAADPSPELLLREARDGDRATLGELARKSFTETIRTRYNTDPWLPIERTGELYRRWFELACDGRFGDMVVAAELEGRPVGFTTTKRDDALSRATGIGFAALGIGAVEPDLRGLDIFPAMAHWLVEWHRKSGGRYTTSRINIDNYAIQRGCLKSGAVIIGAYHSFHLLLPGHRDAPP